MAADPISYIFGGTSGMPTYEELLRRRAIATAQAGRQRKMPTTLGEGMTYLGEAVGDRLESNRLSEAERAFGAAEDTRLAVPSRASTPYGPAAAPAARPAPVGRRVPTERIAPDAAPPGALPGAAPVAPATGSFSEAPADPLDRITAALMTSPQEVAQMDPTLGAPQAPLGSQSDDDDLWPARQHAIGGIESSQDYRAIGVKTKYGHALGRYGVMESNVPKWTAEALGQPLTPQQFLADDKAQDAVFKHRFGQYVAKYGEEKAARAWYGGEGNINNLAATDAHEKLSVHDYGQDYINRLTKKQRRSSAEEPDAAAPIQFASLGGAGGTMTDAPPIGMGGSAAQQRPSVVPEEPDPTVVDSIKPMSVAPNMMAQVGPEMFSPRRMSDTPPVLGAPARPPVAAPGAAAGRPTVPPELPPSLTPIPPASEQVMRDPGAEPKPPERLDFSPRQRAWMDVINNRNSSPYAKEYAKNQFDMEEKVRTEMSARQNEAYRDQRERWQKQRDEFDKFEREAPTRKIEQHINRLKIEAGIAEAEKRPFDLQKLKVDIAKAEQDLEDARYKAGIPRQQAERQGALNIQESERKLAAPETKEIGGVIYQRTPATAGTPAGDWTVAPGSPKKEEKAPTEKQASTIKFLQRATVASSQLGDASTLAGLKDTASGKVPIGGNYLVSPEYQRARSAAFTWAQAVLRDESGAVLGAGEIANKLGTYFPEPGDTEQVIRDKAFRRKAEEDSLYHSLGTAEGKAPIDKWREERKGRKVTADPATGQPYPEGTVRVNPRTGAKQRVMGGHWESEEDLR